MIIIKFLNNIVVLIMFLGNIIEVLVIIFIDNRNILVVDVLVKIIFLLI